MELLKQYMESIEYVNGVYVLKLPISMTMEQAEAIAKEWQSTNGRKKALMITPEDADLQYVTYFDSSIALRMVKSGWKVARASDKDSYIFMDPYKKIIRKKVSTRETEHYTMRQNDLTATDWQIYIERQVGGFHE